MKIISQPEFLEINFPDCLCFDASAQPVKRRRGAERAREIPATKHSDRWWLCRVCRKQIAMVDQTIRIMGATEHVFTNPHGITYQIGCFRDALNCGCVSEPTEAWTWFPGFAWRIVICSTCNQHLGWYFQGQIEAGFFGLILAHLIEDS